MVELKPSLNFVGTKEGRFVFRRLDAHNPWDISALNALLQNSLEYFLQNNGTPVRPDAAQKLFADMPSGKTEQDKFMMALFCDSEMLGFADVMRGRPKPEIVVIRLFLISEKMQGKGLGTMMLAELGKLITSWNCSDIELGVCVLNKRGIRFWRKEGFKEIRREQLPGYLDDIIVMRRMASTKGKKTPSQLSICKTARK